MEIIKVDDSEFSDILSKKLNYIFSKSKGRSFKIGEPIVLVKMIFDPTTETYIPSSSTNDKIIRTISHIRETYYNCVIVSFI